MWQKKIKKKILIIDDEEDFTWMVKMNLERTGRYEVRAENKGACGYAAARSFKPELVLLDLLMLDMEGSDVAAQLSSDEETRNIPVVFLTAVATKEQVEEAGGKIGGQSFIAKPITTQELIDKIDKILSSKR